jgi:hypothetical protein
VVTKRRQRNRLFPHRCRFHDLLFLSSVVL